MMSGKFSAQPIGRKKESDSKVDSLSFNKGSSKKSRTSAKRSGRDAKIGSLMQEKSMSPHPSPGNRMRRIRAPTSSFFEIDGPIGSKRQKDFKSELFSFNFGTLSRKRTSDSKSLPSLQTNRRSDTVASPTKEGSGKNAAKKRRSTRFKAIAIFDSSDESESEENRNSNESHDDCGPSPAKNRKLSSGKNIRKGKKSPALKNNCINSSSDEESLQPKKRGRGRPRKQISDSGDQKHDENMDAHNHDEDSVNELEITRESESVENGPPAPQSDSDNNNGSVETLEFVIEQAHSDYMKLKNSDLTKNLLVVPENCTKTVAGFMSPEFTPSQSEEYPGVVGVQNSLSDSVGVGYMKIEGKTVRPPEMSTSGRMIFWILEGSIKVKSAGGHYPRRESSGEVTNYLYGKKLDQGTCIVMPRMTPFTFENWDSAAAVLGFCIVKETDD